MPYKKSGYYWVQSPCNDTPLRVYCDLEGDIHKAIAVIAAPDG